jgi:hypothetical protein
MGFEYLKQQPTVSSLVSLHYLCMPTWLYTDGSVLLPSLLHLYFLKENSLVKFLYKIITCFVIRTDFSVITIRTISLKENKGPCTTAEVAENIGKQISARFHFYCHLTFVVDITFFIGIHLFNLLSYIQAQI